MTGELLFELAAGQICLLLLLCLFVWKVMLKKTIFYFIGDSLNKGVYNQKLPIFLTNIIYTFFLIASTH